MAMYHEDGMHPRKPRIYCGVGRVARCVTFVKGMQLIVRGHARIHMLRNELDSTNRLIAALACHILPPPRLLARYCFRRSKDTCSAA